MASYNSRDKISPDDRAAPSDLLNIPLPEFPPYVPEPIKVFYCYALEDKILRDELEKHLGALKRTNKIINWHDREILPGIEWAYEIDVRLDSSDLILLLISSDFINSDYCWGEEMRKALAKHKAGMGYVIPVILRPVYWEGTPIEELQILPTEAEPVTNWTNRDRALEDVAKGIRQVVSMLQQKARETYERQREESYKLHKLQYLNSECNVHTRRVWELEEENLQLGSLQGELSKQVDAIKKYMQEIEDKISANLFESMQVEKEISQILGEFRSIAGKDPFRYAIEDGGIGLTANAWPHRPPEIIPGTLPQIRQNTPKKGQN